MSHVAQNLGIFALLFAQYLAYYLIVRYFLLKFSRASQQKRAYKALAMASNLDPFS